MGSPNVTLYVTGWCPYCTRALALLDRKGVAYTAVDIESDRPGSSGQYDIGRSRSCCEFRSRERWWWWWWWNERSS